MNLLNKVISVKLNRLWKACELLSIGDSITFLCEEDGRAPRGFAMDFETRVDENGNRVLVYAQPTAWDDWVKLPVRENDLYVNTSSGKIRAPIVVICAHYEGVRVRTPGWSPSNLRARDQDTCQVSGRKLAKGEGNTGHLIAKSKKGPNSWENTVYMDAKLNSLQGDRTIEEMGWKLIRRPKAPPTMAVVYRKEDAPLQEQTPFLIE